MFILFSIYLKTLYTIKRLSTANYRKTMADRILKPYTAPGVSKVYRFLNVQLNKCKLTNAKACLQRFYNFRT